MTRAPAIVACLLALACAPDNERIERPGYNLRIWWGGYKGASARDVRQFVDVAMTRWDPVVGRDEIIRAFGNDELEVAFDRGPEITLPDGRTYRDKEGLTFGYSGFIAIAFDDPHQPLESTALAHEVGHQVLGRATKRWDPAEHHRLAEEFGLP